MLLTLIAAGCGGHGIGACDQDPDVTGTWTITLTPQSVDGGVAATIPRGDTITADLQQVQPNGILDVGRLVYGTLRSSDAGFFGSIDIPRLTMNDGSKTGSLLGCTMQINVPIAMPVTDDDTDQGPLRISLGGTLVGPKTIAGDPTRSTVILAEDQTMTPRSFAWTATR